MRRTLSAAAAVAASAATCDAASECEDARSKNANASFESFGSTVDGDDREESLPPELPPGESDVLAGDTVPDETLPCPFGAVSAATADAARCDASALAAATAPGKASRAAAIAALSTACSNAGVHASSGDAPVGAAAAAAFAAFITSLSAPRVAGPAAA